MIKKFSDLKDFLIKLPQPFKLIIIAAILVSSYFFITKITGNKSSQTQYQTSQAEKGTLAIVVSASGQVTSVNSATVNTQASGVVKKIFVENGQIVQSGDQIAELDLGMEGKQRNAQAYASYLSAKNSLENAKISYYSLQSDLLNNWKTYMDIAENSTYQNSDGAPNTQNRALPQFMTTNNSWLSAEAKYKNQENVVTQSQISLNSAWLLYQQSSPVIYAPISGTVTGLSLQLGSVLNAETNSSGSSAAQKIASIETDASPVIQVNLTQIDAPKVKIGNKVTLTFDAFSGKTYTGKIISIDTIGLVSSGVTTYPAYIKLDTIVPNLYSNMTALANIITEVKDNILLVPSSAVTTQTDQSFVRVLKNGQVRQITVEIGLSSATQTEIISGLSEGELVITSQTSTSATLNQNQTQSVFGGLGGAGRGIGR